MFKEFLDRHNIQEKKLAAGVSGGSDSLAMILMAAEELKPLGYTLVALTVDHRLRPSSTEEAQYVAKVMEEHQIEHHILVWDDEEKPATGIEEAARQARYGLISAWCLENHVHNVMMAHHLNDQVETFFINLFRGSGLDGLCGMQEVFSRESFNVLRPLLYVKPTLLKEYLNERGIKWIEDESNQCEQLLRVHFRQFLPHFYDSTGISAQRIGETMQRLQCSRHFIEKEILYTIQSHFTKWINYAYCGCFDNFCQLDTEIQFRVLGILIKEIGKSEYPPRAEKISNLINKLKRPDFSSATLGHCLISKIGGKIWILPQYEELGRYNAREWDNFKKAHPQLRHCKLPFNLRVYILNHEAIAEEYLKKTTA